MKRLGFSALEDGMIIKFNNEDGEWTMLVQEADVPSPTNLGSDFHYTVKAFILRPFQVEGSELTPSGTFKYTYLPGFPNHSDIQPTDFELLGFYKVVYQYDTDRKYIHADKTSEDLLIETISNMDPEKLAKILSVLTASVGVKEK